MTEDAELDELYAAAPEDFTSLRTELVAAAKKRGETAAAKRIAKARRPTTAAWVVNAVVRADGTARRRLAELAEELRTAHASMDGPRIRALSAAQRKLVDELVRIGFAATGQAKPSAALRDDVVGTLQAAIADPDVAARLGRLAKAERWSGFGEFGAVTAVSSTERRTRDQPSTSRPTAPPKSAPDQPDDAAIEAARQRRAVASADVDAAAMALREARGDLADARARIATARRRYEKLLETLSAAEQEVETAEASADAVEQTADAAADRLATAEEELAQADRALGAFG